MVTADQIKEIVQILVKECRVERVILFGSYAHGTAQEGSDLDLAIVQKTDLPGFKRDRAIRKALRANGRRWFFPMDILVFTPEEIIANQNNPHAMVHEILLNGKVLYDSTRSTQLVPQG
jgi:uncharacterized protein